MCYYLGQGPKLILVIINNNGLGAHYLLWKLFHYMGPGAHYVLTFLWAQGPIVSGPGAHINDKLFAAMGRGPMLFTIIHGPGAHLIWIIGADIHFKGALKAPKGPQW